MLTTANPDFDMGPKAFDLLNALCQKHPEMFNPISSPEDGELRRFSETFHALSYVRGMMRNGFLRRAIKMLEDEFYAATVFVKREEVTDADWQTLRVQKRLEREVRFVHRLAVIAGAFDGLLALSSPKVARTNRGNAVKALQNAERKLRAVTADEFLWQSLEPMAAFNALLRLANDLPIAAAAIKTAKVEYPFERVRSVNVSAWRLVVDRLADSCYRIYGYCNPAIIDHFQECVWLIRHECSDDPRATMEATLSRKIDAFNRRIPNEDYIAPELTGTWTQTQPWLPAFRLEPPWMEA